MTWQHADMAYPEAKPNSMFLEGVGAAVATDDIELTINLAANIPRNEVLIALDHFRNHILKGMWPPA